MMSTRTHVPRVLSIAGSDSGGGAGIQADLKTFSAFRVFGMSVLTAVTAQNSVGVHTLNKFRRACPTIPVLVVTAVEDKETIHACLKAGAVGYVPKTSAVQTLRTALEAVVAGKLYIPPEAKFPELKPAANGG